MSRKNHVTTDISIRTAMVGGTVHRSKAAMARYPRQEIATWTIMRNAATPILAP